MHSLNKVDKNIEKIGAMFPNCLTERKNKKGEIEYAVDFDVLRQELSASIVEGADERYQFTWPDKKQSILLANAPIAKTLRPCTEESVDFDNTENLYIEGDNLDVLKLLQETYLGKVKMIYIDPPYNTGNDFVYEDDFSQNTSDYLANSGQYDDDGNRLVQNSESNGRFHTDWLNMIYPRLKVAKDLLTDDGVIFISIDDNEVENLRKVCDEVFGEANFVAGFIWKSRQNKDNRNITGVSVDHEHILCYARTTTTRLFRGEERKLAQYKNPDNDTRGAWTSGNMVGLLSESERPNCHYDLINSKTDINYGKPKMGWRYDKKTMSRLMAEERILWPASIDGRPRRKVFLSEISNNSPAFSSVIGEDLYTRNGTLDIVNIFDNKYFDYPKPINLLKTFVNQIAFDGDIVVDFFSGSATTAHAVMQLNAEDGGKRKFIMVQLPETTNEKSEAHKAGYKNICEIGKERIRRAGTKIEKERIARINKEAQKDGLFADISSLDTGFRVLKLDSTNMKDVYYNPLDYNADLFGKLTDNIKEDRSPKDLLFQVMLDLGILLSSSISESVIAGKKVFNVDNGTLITCFDDNVTEETIEQIAKLKPYYFVMRDSSIASDSVATNFEQIFVTYSKDTIRQVL